MTRGNADATEKASPGDASRVRLLVLCGPSGSGKSYLARHLREHHGWPTVSLDDFYRDEDDPGLPQSDLGIPDWDHPGSWDGDAALGALRTLVARGAVTVPRYDIATSRAQGHHEVRVGGAPIVVVEGIFAGEVIGPLRDEGLLAQAWCVRSTPWFTFARRLVRDLAGRRKSPGVLWRRGHQLRRAEPGIVRSYLALGARPLTGRQGRRAAASLLVDSRPAPGAVRPVPTARRTP